MSDCKHIIPFIIKSEGGLSKDPSDPASGHTVPDSSGYHTNKGITWKVFSNEFGVNSIKRFYDMSDEDWGYIFKKLYWNLIIGDQINSQRVADVLVDWVWGSGKYYPEMDVQDILINSFNQHITKDGSFGPETIKVLNSVDEQKLYDLIISKRYSYLDSIVVSNPKLQRFIIGWKNRMANLIKFEQNETK